jgi:dTDP-4-dehydrorhamnose 3,5-epimerase
MKIKLDPKHAKALTFQDYPPQGGIEGVFQVPLTKHRDLAGWFMEYFRLAGGKVESLPVEFQVRQVSISRAAPGRTNAFHLHPKVVQDELWTVVAGTMLVWLVDVRAGSPTRGVKRRCVLSAEQPTLLHVPAGVAHGYQAGPAGALLLYAMNSQFDPDDPNEGRLPWDHFGAELWEADRG